MQPHTTTRPATTELKANCSTDNAQPHTTTRPATTELKANCSTDNVHLLTKELAAYQSTEIVLPWRSTRPATAAASTFGGCFTRCRPCSFFRLPIIFGPSHTSVIIVQRNQPVTFERRAIRHRIPEKVVPRRTPRSRGQLKGALSTAYGHPEDSDFAFQMPPCLRHTPIPFCGGVLGGNSCIGGVSAVLVLILCIPGPLDPGVPYR